MALLVDKFFIFITQFLLTLFLPFCLIFVLKSRLLLGFQPMAYGRALNPRLAMVPMILPDGRLGYVL